MDLEELKKEIYENCEDKYRVWDTIVVAARRFTRNSQGSLILKSGPDAGCEATITDLSKALNKVYKEAGNYRMYLEDYLEIFLEGKIKK